MSKAAERLTALRVKNEKRPGRHADGGNLYLVVSKSGARTWSFLYRSPVAGKQREAGLGSTDSVSLKQAREVAAEARSMLKEKPPRDPIDAWRAERKATAVTSFAQMAEVYLRKKESEWRSDSHAKQVRALLLSERCKALAAMPVDQIATEHVKAAVEAMQRDAPEAALRFRGVIENVLNVAKALGHTDPHKANPARWKGHMDQLVPKKPKPKHFAAMPYAELPAFVAELRAQRETDAGAVRVPAYALEWLILTASRAGETLGCCWDEIDVQARLWTLPESRTKSDRVHRIPLSDPALAIIEAMAAVRVNHLLFPGFSKLTPMTPKTFERLLKGMGLNVTTHGFRSSFRDYAGNETATPHDVCEAALAHVAGDATEQAYRRGDALEKRRKLMELWAAYLDAPPVDNVVALGKRA
jgi:integrase